MNWYIGCSGFHYKTWKNRFYPGELKQNEWLGYYAQHFNTVEINNTFYGLPTERTIDQWKEDTPDNFTFSLKANRFLTHQKNLIIDADFIERYSEQRTLCERLGSKMGCLLWQFPGNFHKNIGRLGEVVKFLQHDGLRHAFEFRHFSWYHPEVMDLLKREHIAFCLLSSPLDLPEPSVLSELAVYLRLHGENEWYKHDYTKPELEEWIEKINALSAESCYVYFNNDFDAKAPKNAVQFRKSADLV